MHAGNTSGTVAIREARLKVTPSTAFKASKQIQTTMSTLEQGQKLDGSQLHYMFLEVSLPFPLKEVVRH